ncbi:hypothetical protein VTN77DRAFT_3677 [Rasamsonia byssochlamydoides]|uniref:uncharacterized protein n=1 Tax=Rasamsonia byssochlamydoides TaxID=89139 RepID=UPI0037448725
MGQRSRLPTPSYAEVAAAAPMPSSPSIIHLESNRYSHLLKLSNLRINSPKFARSQSRPRSQSHSQVPYARTSTQPGLASIPEDSDTLDWSVVSPRHPPPARSSASSSSSSPSFARRASRLRKSRSTNTLVGQVGDQHYLQGYPAQTGPFPPGCIIRVPHFEQHGTTSYTGDAKNKLETDGLGDICFKWRRMVVVTVHKGHHVCLPIYTFNGRGVDPENGGDYRDPEEYVSIFDHRIYGPDHCMTPNEGIKTKFFKDNVHTLHAASVVCLTYPISRRDDCTAIVEGRLKLSSTRRLLQLYMKQTMKSIGSWLGESDSEPKSFNGRDEEFPVSDFFAKENASRPNRCFDLKSDTIVELHDDSE